MSTWDFVDASALSSSDQLTSSKSFLGFSGMTFGRLASQFHRSRTVRM
jgi:hypothetical protein